MVPQKNVGLGKFWQDFKILKTLFISLKVLFLHGLFLFFSSFENFYLGVLGLGF